MSTALISAPFSSTKDLVSPIQDNITLNEYSHFSASSRRPSLHNQPDPHLSTFQQNFISPPDLVTMKQNISETQSQTHIPAQIQLVTDSLKPNAAKQNNNGGNLLSTNGGGQMSCDSRNASESPAPESELRLRRTASDLLDHKRNTSLGSIDLADMIKQQQSLQNIASLHEQQLLRQQHQGPLSNQNGKDLPANRASTANAQTGVDVHYHVDGTTPYSKTPSDAMMDSSTIVHISSTGSPTTTGMNGSEPNGTIPKAGENVSAVKKLSQLRKLLAGVTLTILSAFCFSVTTVIVKFVTDIKPSEMALFRYIGIMVLSFPVVMESKQSWFGDNNWWWRLWMLLRSVSGCTSLFFRYSAVTYISLADTTIIILSMPVFVFIFAKIFLGEQFGRFHVLALFLSLVGIAFASKIEILFSHGHAAVNGTATTIVYNATHWQNATNSLYSNVSTTMAPPIPEPSKTARQLIGSMYALGAVVVGSLVYIMVRKMRKTHHSVILFNFAIISIFEMAFINYIFYDFSLPTNGYSAYLVTILAVFSFYGQLLLTKAIQIEEAGVVSVVRVSGEAFFAFLFQIIIFGEMPDQYTIAGAILVLTAVFLLSYRKYVISLPEDSPHRKKMHWLTK